MFGSNTSHDLIRKYISIFGTLFNNINIERFDANKQRVQYFKVPIQYGPREKYLAMIKAKPDAKVQAIVLPRMSFEITGYTYDSESQLNRNNRYIGPTGAVLELVPYLINFDLNIICKSNVDAIRIVEKIVPYFTPDYTVSAELVEGISPFDVCIDLNSTSHEDDYQGDFEQRRTTTYTLSFTLHGYFAKPKSAAKLIKMIDINTYPTMTYPGTHGERTRTQAGLTADGNPTTELSESIPYQLIEFDDDYGLITTIEDLPDE